MEETEALTFTRELIDWQNLIAADMKTKGRHVKVTTSPCASSTHVPAIVQPILEALQSTEEAFKPDPVFEGWELTSDAIIARGIRSVIHRYSSDAERKRAGNHGSAQKSGRVDGEGQERVTKYRGQTLRYHNERFVERVPFSSVKAILKKGNSILVFEHSYLDSFVVNRNLQYQSRWRSDKFKHPHYPGFASLVLELPKKGPTSDYGSALLALCPAANKVDPEIAHLPKSEQSAIWQLIRLTSSLQFFKFKHQACVRSSKESGPRTQTG